MVTKSKFEFKQKYSLKRLHLGKKSFENTVTIGTFIHALKAVVVKRGCSYAMIYLLATSC